MRARVSIISPAYRCRPFIGQMVRSILGQTYDRWELLIVDDSSDDGTYEVAIDAAGGDPRVRVLRHLANRGQAAAFNTGLQASSGEFIARQDADDWSYPDRIERSVEKLATCDLVTCDITQSDGRHATHIVTGGMQPDRMLNGEYYGPVGSSVVARSGVYSAVGGLNPECVVSSDSDWYFRALLHPEYQWDHIPEGLYVYRRHPGQMTHTKRGLGIEEFHRARMQYRDEILANRRTHNACCR